MAPLIRVSVMRSRSVRIFVPWTAAIVWAGLIFIASAQSNASLSADPATDWELRKAAHLFVYAVLAFLVASGLGAIDLPHRALAALVLATLYGLSDEIHQAFVVGRSAMAIDVVIDGIGTAIGVAVWASLRRRRKESTGP